METLTEKAVKINQENLERFKVNVIATQLKRKDDLKNEITLIDTKIALISEAKSDREVDSIAYAGLPKTVGEYDKPYGARY